MKIEDFKCPHCGVNLVEPNFYRKLEEAIGAGYGINSGYRCHVHNDVVGGEPNSAHLRGLAADIAVLDNRQRYDLLKALFKAGFSRIGIGRGFVHVDTDYSLPNPRVWVY